jgi:hypothetical protein
MDELKEYTSGLADIDFAIENDRKSLDFAAIQDVPPQKTLFLHVTGQVLVSNPGVVVELDYAEPQGINPSILLLKLYLIQRPGIWPQVLSWKTASYRSGIIQYNQYSQVQIDANGTSILVDVVDRV